MVIDIHGGLQDHSQHWLYLLLLGPWNPHSVGNMLFDCIGLVVLLYDLGLTTIQLAWDVPITVSFFLCSCVSVAYWTVAILVTFRTGFYERGEVKMGSHDIACHYFRKNFFFDFLIVVVDWVALVTVDAAGAVGVLRVLRLFRLARSLKVIALFKKISSSSFGTESTGFILLKIGGFTLIFTHIMCCVWYGIGTIQVSDTGMHWIDDFHGSGSYYMYLVAYHWVLSQITLIGNDVDATNSYERAFTIALTVFGLLYSSTIVSIISARAMEYVTTSRDHLEHMSRLSTFLEQHKVNLRISNRVRRQANDRLKSSAEILSEDGVKALSLLSTDLQSDLLHEVRSPHVVTHPLFQLWSRIDVGATRRLCQEAVCFITVMSQDCAFMPSETATRCFYITSMRSGSILAEKACPMLYTQSPETAFVEDEETHIVKEGTWVAEAALWTEWTYVGKLTAQCACHLLTMDAAKVQGTLSQFGHVIDLTRTYAREFCLRLRSAAPPFSSWPNDLYVPGADPGNLLSGQAYSGLLTSEWNSGHLNITKKAYEELLEEVNAEKSAIVSMPEGLQRVVFICALQIQNADDHIFVQVGKWSEERGPESAGAILPGTKRDRSELPHKALLRLLQSSLTGLQEGIMLSHANEESEYKPSLKFGMMSKYLRTVNFAEMREDFEMPSWPVAEFLSESPPGLPYGIDELPSCCNTEVYVIHTKPDSADLYAWLPEDDVHLFRGEDEDVLKSWMQSLDHASCRRAKAPTHCPEDTHVGENSRVVEEQDLAKHRALVLPVSCLGLGGPGGPLPPCTFERV